MTEPFVPTVFNDAQSPTDDDAAANEPYIPESAAAAAPTTTDEPYVPESTDKPFVPNAPLPPPIPVPPQPPLQATDPESNTTVATRGFSPLTKIPSVALANSYNVNSMRATGWLDDDNSEITYGRRIARYLSKYSWYHPKPKDDGGDDAAVPPANLDAAWAFFEHVTLARYLVEEVAAAGKHARVSGDEMKRAKQGETEKITRLYSYWGTPEGELADWGIGVGMYFAQLRALAIIFTLAGLINVPVMLYYASERYSYSKATLNVQKWSMLGSAICTNQTWVPCPDCDPSSYKPRIMDTNRWGTVASSTNGPSSTLNFILKNQCEVSFNLGLLMWVSLMFCVVGIFILMVIQRKNEVLYDLKQQTASDYSVEVENPPYDADDVNDWKDFFSQFGHVTCVTITKDNTKLVKALVKRRKLMQSFELKLPPGVAMDPTRMDEICRDIPPRPLWKKILCGWLTDDIHAVYWKIFKLDENMRSLLNDKARVTNVFVTFETEEAQRRCLTQLSVAKKDMWMNNHDAFAPDHIFQRNTVLYVREPHEPDSVRWDDLDETLRKKAMQRIVTFTCTIGLIAINAWIIAIVKERSPVWAGLTVTALNTIAPFMVYMIDNIEAHSDEGSKQNSRYIKITMFRWTNTAIVVAITTPFTRFLEDSADSLLYPVYAIFFAEMVKGPIMQFSDIFGTFYRHILGPRQKDQRNMNLCFTGSGYELSERYTDMTKIMFLSFFFAVLYPGGYIFGGVTFMIHYLTDKFSLMKSWRSGPRIGSQLSRFSRGYFFTAAVLASSMAGAYLWASFPFDNACVMESTASDTYIGTFNISVGDGTYTTATIQPWFRNYQYCTQDLFSMRAFPALPKFMPEGGEWMSEGQTQISRYYGWTSVAILILVCGEYLRRGVLDPIVGILISTYKPTGKVAGINFSDVENMMCYIPQVRAPGFLYPLLACDISDIPEEHQYLIGWDDPLHGYDPHNLIFDVMKFIEEDDQAAKTKMDVKTVSKKFFSRIEHWPPPGASGHTIRQMK